MGQTFMGLESTTNQMMWMGESLLSYGKVLDPAAMEKKVLSVTPEEVQRVACHCLRRGRLGVAVVGPVKEAEVEGWVASRRRVLQLERRRPPLARSRMGGGKSA